jgi:peptidoglycan-associated lipoprotein
MKRKIQLFIIFCLAASLISIGSGCANSKRIKEEAAAAEAAKRRAEEEAAAAKKKAEAEAAAAAAKKKAEAEAAAAAAKKRAEEEAASAAAAKKRADEEAAAKRLMEEQVSAFESEKIYFDYDKADLKPEAQAVLQSKAKFLDANSSYSVTIEGNCDERGTNEYNLALGERRADAAKKYLASLGISEGRITTVSYGEEKPVAAGKDESAWSQNRRDEFKLN